MPAFKPDIEILKSERFGQGEGTPTLTKSDWMKLIIN